MEDAMTTNKPFLMTVTAFVKRHPLLTYYSLTFAISWGGILMVMGIGHSGILATSAQFTRLLPFAIPPMLGGPTIACLVVTGIVSGRAGYNDLWSHLHRWRVDASWYAVAILAAPLVALAVPLALGRSSPVFLPTLFTLSDKASPLMFGIVWGLVVGFFEELGWTGFAVPRLRLRYSMVSTGLIAGTLWGAWHLLSNDVWGAARLAGTVPVPLFLIVNGVLLVGGLTAVRIVMVWVYDHTQSLPIIMLMHASYTACALTLGSSAIGMAFLAGSFVSDVVWWLIVAVVLIASVRATGRQVRRQPLGA